MSDSNMLSVLFSGDQSYVYQHEIIVSVFAVFVLGTHSVAGGTCSLQAVYMQSTWNVLGLSTNFLIWVTKRENLNGKLLLLLLLLLARYENI